MDTVCVIATEGGIHIYVLYILFNIIYIIGKINVVQEVLMFITGCL